jgi:1-acyl-sn-glycerol-3-phosphate acyltransferase
MSHFTAYRFLVYYLSLLLFGLFGLVLSLFCLALGWLPEVDGVQRFFQNVIHRHFELFIWWNRFTGMVRVRFDGLDRIPRGGLVIVANHPSLLDVTYLLSQLPEAVCIFKPAIRRNPILGASARRAGYLASDGGVDLVREAAARAAAGRTLVVFPEGTRTRRGFTRAFKPGFVLIARRAGVPIQLVRIACDSNVLSKDLPWWKLPKLPASVVVTIGPLIEAGSGDMGSLARKIEAWFNAEVSPAAP